MKHNYTYWSSRCKGELLPNITTHTGVQDVKVSYYQTNYTYWNSRCEGELLPNIATHTRVQDVKVSYYETLVHILEFKM